MRVERVVPAHRRGHEREKRAATAETENYAADARHDRLRFICQRRSGRLDYNMARRAQGEPSATPAARTSIEARAANIGVPEGTPSAVSAPPVTSAHTAIHPV